MIVLHCTLEGVVPCNTNNIYTTVTVNLAKKRFQEALKVGLNLSQSKHCSTQAHNADTRPSPGFRVSWFEGKLVARLAKRRRASAALALKLAIAIVSTTRSTGIYTRRNWHVLSGKLVIGLDACYRISTCSMSDGDCWQQHQVLGKQYTPVMLFPWTYDSVVNVLVHTNSGSR